MKNSHNQVFTQKTCELIDKLILGKFSLLEIAKVTGIPEPSLEDYINKKYKFAC